SFVEADSDRRGASGRRGADADSARVHRRGCDAMWILHERDADLRVRAAPPHLGSVGAGNSTRARRAFVSLWNLRSRDPRGAEGIAMTTPNPFRSAGPMHIEERISIEPDGTVVARSGKVEFGQGIRTAFAKIVAEELDVPIENVRVELGETDVTPWDFGTFGSMSVATDGQSLRL